MVSAGTADIGGMATIRGSAPLRAMLVIGFGSALVVAPLLGVLLPAHFNGLGEPTWFGFTMSAFAAGSMIGAILYAVIASRSRRAVYVGGLLLQTLGMVGFTTLHGVWPVAIGSALVGIGGGLLSPVFIVFFTEQVAESVRGRVLGLFNALALIASPLGLGAIALALSVTTLEVAATWLLAAWVLVMAYAFISKGMRTFAESPAPRSRRDRSSWRPTVLTISQLARYVGVSVRTVRHYHQLGLLAEPERDGSGYRRYGADDVIALKRISTLARAGVPLARISGLLAAEPDEFVAAIGEIDADLEAQMAELRQRRSDLAQLPSAERLCIPDEVAEILAWEREIGLSETSVEIERNSWILLSAAYPVDARGVPGDEADLPGRRGLPPTRAGHGSGDRLGSRRSPPRRPRRAQHGRARAALPGGARPRSRPLSGPAPTT